MEDFITREEIEDVVTLVRDRLYDLDPLGAIDVIIENYELEDLVEKGWY